MKESVIQFAMEEYKKIKSNDSLKPQEKLYQFSMPLLAVAALKESSDYKEILTDMEQILSEESTESPIEKPWQLWMMGRMAVAAKLEGDSEKLKSIKEKLTTQLFENDNKDVITGWAFAYLASLDEESYQKCREKLFEYKKLEETQYNKDSKKEASNYVWTLVMNLYASANAGKEDYAIFLTELKELTNNKTLYDTSLLVPETDYRQWLVSLERYSFAIMKDQSSLDELTTLEHSSSIDSFDSMLEWANTLITPGLSTEKNAENPYRFQNTEVKKYKEQSITPPSHSGDFKNN